MFPLSTLPLAHGTASEAMTSLPLLSPSEVLADPCPWVTDSCNDGTAVWVADPARLMHQLRDPLHPFDLESMRLMLPLLSEAATALAPQFPLPPMVWCAPAEAGRRAFHADGLCLLIGPAATEHGRELHSVLIIAQGAVPRALPAHLSATHRFRCPPNDVFDVVVTTLENAGQWNTPSRDAGRPGSGAKPGMALRWALADWMEATWRRPQLRTPSPMELPRRPSSGAGPSPLASAEASIGRSSVLSPTSPAPPVWLVSPVSSLPVSPTPGSPAHALQPTASPLPASPLPASPLPAPPLINATLMTETQALATLVREGGWSSALDRVAPQLLSRLPPDNPLCLRKVEVKLPDGQVMQFGVGKAGEAARQIHWYPEEDEAYVSPAPGAEQFHVLGGRHAYLVALLGGAIKGRTAVNRAVRVVADLIERHPEVAALSLAIFKRWPGRDPEVMLRFCLHGAQLRPAGRQLLNAPPDMRDMSADEIAQWQVPPALLRLTPEGMEAQGWCMADARWHLSPMGVSSHGLKAIQQARLPVMDPNTEQQTTAWEAVANNFPQLRYELGSLDALATFLRQPPMVVLAKVPRDRFVDSWVYREEMKKTGVLETPELIQDTSGTSRRPLRAQPEKIALPANSLGGRP